MSTSDYPALRLRDPWLLRLRVALVAGAASARALPAETWALGALIVVAAGIRIITIDNQSFWMDEALTAYEAHLPFGAMLNTVAHVETTPPLYFFLIWAWAHVLGTGEIALRSLSTLAGIALVPIAFLCARELTSRRAGLVAAALVTVNPFLIWYSQEARAYMLLAALSGASFLWFIRARREPSRRNLAWWGVFSCAAVMTHFFAGFAVAPEAVWLLWVARTRVAVLAVAVVAAVQAAMLPFALIDTGHGVGWIAAIPPLNRISETALEWMVSILYRTTTIKTGLVAGAAVILVIALALGFGGDRLTWRAAKVGAVIGGVVILIPLALGALGQDYFLSRNLIPAFIPLVTVVAAACVAPRARVLGGALAIGLIAVFALSAIRVQTKPYLQRPQWRNVAAALGPATVPQAILVAGGSTADALKIYLPHVNWVQPRTRRFLIKEIEIVGATKRFPLIPGTRQGAERRLGRKVRLSFGRPIPRSVAPPGMRLVSRFRVRTWVIDRFLLAHPMRISIDQLARLAPRFFRNTPQALNTFVQQPGR